MKLIPLLWAKAFLFLCFLTPAQAQEESPQTLKYGIKVGAVMSELNASYHTGSKLGFSAGAFGNYELSQMLSLQIELSYFQAGGSYLQFTDESRFGGSSDFFNKNVKDAAVTLHHIYLPLQVVISPFNNPSLPQFLIGPYASYNVAASERYQKTGQLDGGVFVTTTGEAIVTDQYEDFHFGAMAGVQFELPVNDNLQLIIGAAYNYGLTPVKQSFSYIDFVEVTENVMTSAFSFNVGVQF